MIAPTSRLPARTRLTLWYTLLLAGSMLALGGLGLWVVERTLYANADELLRSKAAAVLTDVEFERGRLVVDLSNEPNSESAPLLAGLDVVRVWDRRGRLLFRHENKPDVPMPDAAVEAIAAGQRELDVATVRTPAGEAVRTYAEPVRDNDRVVGVVQVGRSEAEIEAVLGQLRALGAGGLLIALALGWVGGSFLARRALAPVDRITRAAEQIGADDLSQRLGLSLPDDELGRLAAAFDGMIGRLDRAFQRQRQFTADASHELRTPLAIIRSQADVALGRSRQPDYYARVLTSICEECQRLERLTENLLMLARADAGESVALGPLDLEELVAEAGARIAPRTRERGVQLAVSVGAVGLVRGDADWMTQLLMNLLDNALRHTPPGGQVTL
ncbi:MAG: HAMP domain-containing protein, partial [Chloroflexi bacterium]|nr:HAMP domain-containing protein [Chloroflexota bacterium]